MSKYFIAWLLGVPFTTLLVVYFALKFFSH